MKSDGKLTCPRCGARMLPVRGSLPVHTTSVEGTPERVTYDYGLYPTYHPATPRAVICE